MTMNDLESPALFRLADALGWTGATKVNMMCDFENMRIIIARSDPACVICGEGAFRALFSVGGRDVCEKCAVQISRELSGYYYGDRGR